MNPDAIPTRPVESRLPAPRGCDDAPPDDGRLRQAFLASARDELLAPANAILEVCQSLLDDLGDVVETTDRGPQSFLNDLGKIRASAQRLGQLVKETFSPTAASREAQAPDLKTMRSRARHDMRNELNSVINYSDLWLEEAADHGLEGFLPDLRLVRDQGTRCCTSLDRIIDSLESGVADLGGQRPGFQAVLKDVVAYIRPTEEPGTAPAGHDTILVVDDNPDNREILSRHLVRQGHAVVLAENGRQALERLTAEPIDLVLLDIIMPEMNGFQVLERLKADPSLRHIPVVVISALDEIDSMARCIEMGAEDYLPRPFNRTLLRARIGACLEKKRLRDREVLHLAEIERERKRSDELLHVILPHEIVEELRETNQARPRRHDDVAVLFADIVGFTTYCDRHCPEEVVTYLQQLVEAWEDIALAHGVEKIKTIGDAFMAASGLLKKAENPVLSCVRCGLEMIAACQALPVGWNLRVGVHAGQVVAGVLGRRQYLFDLWGDTVNTAARMESHGVPGAVTLSGSAWQRVRHCCRGESLGVVKVKGKGDLEMVRLLGFQGGAAPS